MANESKILPLRGAIRHYDWGGTKFIPNLINTQNPDNEPFAELWMGAHPSAPAVAQQNGSEQPLNEAIESDPRQMLGEQVAKNFQNRLPYLFKVLDVQKMLSIQAHPTKEQAEAGFQRENEAGIPLDARHRNYKDDNHKPELMVALTDFWLLHGFRPMPDIKDTIHRVPEFEALQSLVANGEIYALYKYIMEMPQADVDAMLQPLEARLTRSNPEKNSPDYWAKQAFSDHPPKNGDYDRGVFSIYLLNLLKLKPGEAIFQAAGVPHAYLEGVNVELMANSDNVFRGGLTSKHVDVDELLKSLVFDAVDPHIINGEQISATEIVFRTPAPDFELRKIEVSPEHAHECPSAEAPHTLIVLDGEVEVNARLTFQRGDIFFAPAGAAYRIESKNNTKAVLYKATVP
jgi:mannose-6-phosphate isomerase